MTRQHMSQSGFFDASVHLLIMNPWNAEYHFDAARFQHVRYLCTQGAGLRVTHHALQNLNVRMTYTAINSNRPINIAAVSIHLAVSFNVLKLPAGPII